MLANYVNDFFGPEGPYPTETEAETSQRQQLEARQQFEAEIAQQEQQAPGARQLPASGDGDAHPRPSVQPRNDFWGGFSEMMDARPEDAWKYLSQAPAGALQTKMLVQDS